LVQRFASSVRGGSRFVEQSSRLVTRSFEASAERARVGRHFAPTRALGPISPVTSKPAGTVSVSVVRS
jgi:hypothetical protein